MAVPWQVQLTEKANVPRVSIKGLGLVFSRQPKVGNISGRIAMAQRASHKPCGIWIIVHGTASCTHTLIAALQ